MQSKHTTLLPLIPKKSFVIGKFEITSQEPTILPTRYHPAAARYLAIFMAAWRAIEQATGHRWKCTSFVRDSPSHKRGQAFDLAPDFSSAAASGYAVTNGSDPVLYKRRKLIQQLQTLRDVDFSGDGTCTLGIFIEPDHLHLQVMAPGTGEQFPTSIVKWKVLKPVYADTEARASLPEYI